MPHPTLPRSLSSRIHPRSSLVGQVGLALALTLAVATVEADGFKPLPGGKPAAVEKHLLPLSPADELKTLQLPEGYRLELVLSEPDIREPMAITFDGNGRLYVVEMRTYMQDIEGRGELEAASRVSRHESSRRDGVFDKHSVFADHLKLPRMVLPLQDEVLIGTTDTNDILAWRDRDEDGVAESNRVFYAGGPRGGNLEHQPSGLLWAMDNWLYTTYNAYRLRWTAEGVTLKEPTAPNGGQWGLTQDDWGRPWFSNAGGEIGIWNFQTHIAYGAVNVPSQWPADWKEVWPAIGLGDVQGGPGRLRDDGTLNHFTATCGHEIFRGDRLPEELRGNVFIPEPVGRLIRRGVVEVVDGITRVHNPYTKSEFIRSTDANFRPVNMATGPDGCLYIADTYRGIIQEGNWTKADSFLRPQIQRWGLDKNVGRGRIWRLVHRDFKPGPQPRLLDEASHLLVTYLGHPNGWWRDMAQKLLVVRQDKTVIPALVKSVRNHPSPLGRAHALWTLEGLAAVDVALVRSSLKDPHPLVREAALRVSESLVKMGSKVLEKDILAMGKDPDPKVVIQAIGTAKRLGISEWAEWARIILAGSSSRGVIEIGTALTLSPKKKESTYTKSELAVLKKGEAIYRELCFACHGNDGKGMVQQAAPQAGGLVAAIGAALGPPLAGSRTVTGPNAGPVLVLLHGLAGPVSGKTYEAQMVSMSTNPDEWIADISSYIRNSFGNRTDFVSAEEVKRLRAEHPSRTEPWTEVELHGKLPEIMTNTRNWKLTASIGAEGCAAAVDGKPETRWDTRTPQVPGQWFQIELPAVTQITGLRLECERSPEDYPRGYKVQVSDDGRDWSGAGTTGSGGGAVMEIPLVAAKTRFVRVTQTGSAEGKLWSIHEIRLFAVRSFP